MTKKRGAPLRLFIISGVAAVLLVFLTANAADGGAFTVTKKTDGKKQFVNNADGYALTVPENAVINTDFAEVRTSVTYDGVRLYIYAEHTGGAAGQDSYISHSNGFLSTGRDVTATGGGEMKIGGCDAIYNFWRRRPLSRIENDLYNYACFDIKCGEGLVYTLMFKYDDDNDYEVDILPVAMSFEPRAVTAKAPEVHLGTNDAPSLNNAAQAAFDRLFAADAPLTWGIFMPHLENRDEVCKLEAAVGHEFQVYLIYCGFNVTDDGHPMVSGKRLDDMLDIVCPDGKIPELTLQTYPQDEGLMIYDVLDGVYDDFLHSYAAAVADFQRPVLMRLCNEMNGDWCSYCAAGTCRDTDIFVFFYRYVFDIFAEEGADNAIWIFNPNSRSFPAYRWNHELMYYPGDEYVNVVGMTAYNTGTYYKSESWHTFDELYRGLSALYVRRYSQPFMITEFACSGIGGDKAAWIDDMFTSLPDYPMIKAAVWWSHCDYDRSDPENPVVSRSYILDENEDTIAAFRRGIKKYGGGR